MVVGGGGGGGGGVSGVRGGAGEDNHGGDISTAKDVWRRKIFRFWLKDQHLLLQNQSFPLVKF